VGFDMSTRHIEQPFASRSALLYDEKPIAINNKDVYNCVINL